MPPKIKGYTIFIVECADSSFYSGMCESLPKKLRNINSMKEPYFKKWPKKAPVRVVYQEDHLPFREAYQKHRVLRDLNRRDRKRMIKMGHWINTSRLNDLVGFDVVSGKQTLL